ncbi:MAG: hypothetical protein ABSC56_00335 [Solirubrobacteraceae bacterium]
MLTTLTVLVGFVVVYFIFILEEAPPAVSAVVNGTTAELTLQTVGSYGHHPYPDWVSYMIRDPSGKWQHSTIFDVPASTKVVHVTLYEYDTATGLRNPFFAYVRGTTGGVIDVNGQPMSYVNAASPAHTFTAPDLGLNVPLPGVNANAKNQCAAAPCNTSEAHNTISFSFKTPKPGDYRFQCIVPCALGFLYGFGGPMQTIGYMDGEIQVT